MSKNPNADIGKRFNSFWSAKKTLYTFFVLVITLIVLELFATFLNSNPDWFIRDEKNNTTHISFNEAALSSRYYSFSTSPYFSSQNFSLPKNKNAKRIFVIGNTVVSGWPYTERQSIATKVKALLTKFNLLNNVEIIPISFAGFNSSNAVELINEIKTFDPDMIILFMGHNEFYTHDDLTPRLGEISFNLVDMVDRLLIEIGLKKEITFDKNIHDLETVFPELVPKRTIIKSDPEYISAVKNFRNNLSEIIKTCKTEKINLLLPVITDNLLVPPLGIVQNTKEIQADIIFSNARMAIYRDGDIEKAKALFLKTKELDAVKIRMPEEIKSAYEQGDIHKSFLVKIDSLFEINCVNNIPSSELFLDYIHPNYKGMNIIAAALTEKIIGFLNKTSEPITFDSLYAFANAELTITTKDSILAELRLSPSTNQIIDKSL